MEKKIVVARIQIIEGKEKECLSLVSPLVESVKAEPGNLVYTVYQGIQNPCEFIIYEEYINEEAFKEHCSTTHFQYFGQAIKPFIAQDIDIKVL